MFDTVNLVGDHQPFVFFTSPEVELQLRAEGKGRPCLVF